MAAVLVYGWYGRGNAGDELMKRALVGMFRPRGLELSFVDRIGVQQLLDYDKPKGYVGGVIFGGGSILIDAPDVSPEALVLLLTGEVPVFYIGVGFETEVHPVHRQLLAVARVVAARERDIPDLAFSLPDTGIGLTDPPRRLLVIPNAETVPTWQDPHWMHVAWERFKDEAAQAFDAMVDDNVSVSFLLMCSNPRLEDAWAAGELMARMRRRDCVRPVFRLTHDVDALALVRAHRAVLTQRYHGIILSEMAGVPYVSIDHHDKLKNARPSRGLHLPFHGACKDDLIVALNASLGAERMVPHRVPSRVYDDLADAVVGIVKERG